MTIPLDIVDLITSKYDQAIANGDIEFVETQRLNLSDPKTGMNFMLSHTPSLLKKPERADIDPTKKINPFESPEPELTVLNDVTGNSRYKFVLNKFPVIPEHGLLITNKFEHQAFPLNIEDVTTCHQLVSKLNQNNNCEKYIIFYNSGIASGSSQDHKHMQILKLPNNLDILQDTIITQEKPDDNGILSDRNVSFANFVMPLPENPKSELLYSTYKTLLEKALQFKTIEFKDQKDHNVIISGNWMCVIPRSSTRANSMNIGFNSLGYVGIILVKQLEVFNEIVQDPSLLNKVLLECGFPNRETSSTKTLK